MQNGLSQRREASPKLESALPPQQEVNSPPLRQVRQKLRQGLPYAAGILATIMGLLLYNYFFPPPTPLTQQTVDNRISEALAEATPKPAYSATVYEIILPSLVFIKTSNVGPVDGNLARAGIENVTEHNQPDRVQPIAHTGQGDEPQDENQNPDPEEPEEEPEPFGIGGGVIISAEGAILTALHVVDRAEAIQVTFADGTKADAVLVAAEPDNDIAVLQVDQLPEIFAPATLGNPNALRIGDEAYAVGNPLGLAGSMSAGVISGLNRTATPANLGVELDRLIQFDAAVNPGNSGGPLLNRNGEVVGIVVGLVNPMEGVDFSGIGLAVRIDVAGGAAGAPPQ